MQSIGKNNLDAILLGFNGLTDPWILQLKESLGRFVSKDFTEVSYHFMEGFSRHYLQNIIPEDFYSNGRFGLILEDLFAQAWDDPKDLERIVPKTMKFFQAVKDAADLVEGPEGKILAIFPFFSNQVAYYWFLQEKFQPQLSIGETPFYGSLMENLAKLSKHFTSMDPVYLRYLTTLLLFESQRKVFSPNTFSVHPLSEKTMETVFDFLVELVASCTPEFLHRELADGEPTLFKTLQNYSQLELLFEDPQSFKLMRTVWEYEFVDMAVRHRALEAGLEGLNTETLFVIFGLHEDQDS